MGLSTTKYDRVKYRDVYKPTGETIQSLRQVDEFALACSNVYIAEDTYDKIGNELQLCRESDRTFPYIGIFKNYNIIDIKQYSYSVSYI